MLDEQIFVFSLEVLVSGLKVVKVGLKPFIGFCQLLDLQIFFFLAFFLGLVLSQAQFEGVDLVFEDSLVAEFFLVFGVQLVFSFELVEFALLLLDDSFKSVDGQFEFEI